jgi:hypothetical protein
MRRAGKRKKSAQERFRGPTEEGGQTASNIYYGTSRRREEGNRRGAGEKQQIGEGQEKEMYNSRSRKRQRVRKTISWTTRRM